LPLLLEDDEVHGVRHEQAHTRQQKQAIALSFSMMRPTTCTPVPATFDGGQSSSVTHPVDILVGSGRLVEFISNPDDFIQVVKTRLQSVLAEIVVDGVQYEQSRGYLYELHDGLEEKDRFIDQMYKLQHPEKSDFDYAVYDSEPKRAFAELLDSREDVNLFMKLPAKFKVPIPVGDYNPDWAIIKHEDLHDPRDQEHRRRGQASVPSGAMNRAASNAAQADWRRVAASRRLATAFARADATASTNCS
jgi:hypothetical protein